jgi:hypothetical protein
MFQIDLRRLAVSPQLGKSLLSECPQSSLVLAPPFFAKLLFTLRG